MITIEFGNGSRKAFEKLLRNHLFVNEDFERLDDTHLSNVVVVSGKLGDDFKLDLSDISAKVTVKSGDCRYKDTIYYSAAHMEAILREKKHEAEKGLSILRGK